MGLPFSESDFFESLARYNADLWPVQLAFYALAIATIMMVFFPHRFSDRLVSMSLAALWAWMGGVYHLVYFSDINPAARYFAVLFLVAAALFAWEGGVRNRLHFRNDALRSGVGLALLAYALIAYPLLALLFGRGFPQTATLGLPCPSVIFTLGILAFLRPHYPRRVFVVPLLWTLVGAQAALLFGVYEDLGLLVAGAAGAWLVLLHSPKAGHAS